MGTHPLNLAFRFVLEIAALVSVGMWGWRQADNWLRFALAIGIPVGLAVIWATFAVPDDPSRSGAAPVPTNGAIRLVLELAVFGFGVWTLNAIGFTKPAILLAFMVIVHYLLSYDRITWLFAR